MKAAAVVVVVVVVAVAMSDLPFFGLRGSDEQKENEDQQEIVRFTYKESRLSVCLSVCLSRLFCLSLSISVCKEKAIFCYLLFPSPFSYIYIHNTFSYTLCILYCIHNTFSVFLVGSLLYILISFIIFIGHSSLFSLHNCFNL